jgi:hypothetical protein
MHHFFNFSVDKIQYQNGKKILLQLIWSTHVSTFNVFLTVYTELFDILSSCFQRFFYRHSQGRQTFLIECFVFMTQTYSVVVVVRDALEPGKPVTFFLFSVF